MAFYRFKNMTYDEADVINQKLGLDLRDQYIWFLHMSNGGRFEYEDEHPLYVEHLDTNIWIDVLYGVTKNYRSNLFYWNDKYREQIPENAIIIGDTQNNGFLVYIYEGFEKGIYYWDDGYSFDCSDENCNAYLVAKDIEALLKNIKIKAREVCDRKGCKPDKEIGKNNVRYRASDGEMQIMDAAVCKEMIHCCEKFQIKWEMTVECEIRYFTQQGIEVVERDTGYVFSESMKKYFIDNNYKSLDKKHFEAADGSIHHIYRVLCFDRESFQVNAWYINCDGYGEEKALEEGNLERVRALQELHKNYIVFAHDYQDAVAIDKLNDDIVIVYRDDLRIEKVAENFDSFIDSLFDNDECLRRKAAIKQKVI